MDATTALAVLGGLLALALGLGATLSRRAQRVARLTGAGQRIDPVDLGAERLGARATIVQFSTEFCARCPSVRRISADLAARYASVDFVHVDLAHRPGLASRFGLLQTPTVLILDGGGVPRSRLSGAVTRDRLTEELDALTGGTDERG